VHVRQDIAYSVSRSGKVFHSFTKKGQAKSNLCGVLPISSQSCCSTSQMWRIKEFRIFHVLFCITFLVNGLAVNLVQLCLYCVCPRPIFHSTNYYLVCLLYGPLVCLADWWGGVSLTVYCSDKFQEKLVKKSFNDKQLVVVNHHTELDWLFAWQLCDRCGLLGSCRAMAKASLRKLPVLGWSAIMSGDVFLSRCWETDKILIREKIEYFDKLPPPTWLFVFPEGTRFNQEKHKKSLEFAESRGLPRLNHHLIPRTKGFTLITPHMTGGLLDLTFVEGAGAPPTLTSLLMGKSVDSRVFVREFSLSDVPKGEKEAGEWLMQLWKSKDEIKAAYLADDWERLAELGEFVVRNPERRLWSLIWSVFTNILVLIPLLWFLLKGSIMTWIGALVFLFLSWLSLGALINVSKIKKKV